MESILISIKKLLNIEDEDHHFDEDLITHINSVIFILTQVGIGPEDGFAITGDTENWADFLGPKLPKLMAIKTYVYLKVRIIFDPPSSSAAIDSINRLISEFESRLNIASDSN